MATQPLDPLTLLGMSQGDNDPLSLLDDTQSDVIPGIPEVPENVPMPDVPIDAPNLDFMQTGSPLDLGYPQTEGTFGVPQSAIELTEGLPIDLDSLDDESAGVLAQAYARKQDLDARAAERLRMYQEKIQDEEFQRRDRNIDIWRSLASIPAVLLGAPGVQAVQRWIGDPSKQAETAYKLSSAKLNNDIEKVDARIKSLIERRQAAQEAIANETTARRGQDLDYDLGLKTIDANAAKRRADAAAKAKGAVRTLTNPYTNVAYDVPDKEWDEAKDTWKETYLENKSVKHFKRQSNVLR